MIVGEALHSDASGDYVWLVREDRVEKHAVRVGGRHDRAQVLVVSGLNLGDTIVRTSDAPLRAGQTTRTD
jgi:hypothetical protein